jgi:hypothetical protein
MDSQARRYITTDRLGQKIPAVRLAERRQNVRNLNLVVISLCFRSRGITRLCVSFLGLDAFKIAAQGAQAFLAIDMFAVRQDQTKQLRIGGSNISHRFSKSRQELVEPFVGEVYLCYQGSQSCQ